MAKHPREVDILAALAAVSCIAFGYLSRQALNPDGVSYLDLAGAMQRNDWWQVVQGYWSPLLPILAGAIGVVTGRNGTGLVLVAHAINTIAALGTVFVLWRWARREQVPGAAAGNWVGRAFLAGFLICSAGLPRIEAVTPDILLLLIMAWLSHELIVNGSRRWLLVGVLLGFAFLTKTSSWPWLIAAIPLRLWAATSAGGRRQVLWSTVACVGVMLTWIVPLTMKYGHPTLGSSGRLNYDWYISAHTSRLPDTDRGTNSAYQSVDVGSGRFLTVAAFDDAALWTYQPWGDPTGWATKVLSQAERNPTPLELVTYWLRMFARVFGLWLGPLIAFILLPCVVVRYRPRMIRELVTTQRDSLVVMLLGLIGLLQFVAIHAEPRLIAPFGLMLALGTIHWCFTGPEANTRFTRSAPTRQVLSWLGPATVIFFALFRFADSVESAARLREVTVKLDDLRQRLATVSAGPLPIAVVGPAAPVMAAAFWANVHIAAQVTPPYAALIAALPKKEQEEMLISVFRGKVPMIWRTSADGGMEMLVIPPN